MKKIDFKPILISIGLIIFQSICFALSKILCGDVHLLGNAIDQKIPFNIIAVLPYSSWYFMLFIAPYIYYKKNKTVFTKYCLAYIFTTIVANIIFVAYPSTVIRPVITGNSILELMTRLIFWVDTPVLNCFPSLHCAMSMLWLLYTLTMKESSKNEKIIIPIISILIMISTLFIKQHVFIDLVSGDIIASVIFIVLMYDKKLTKRFKELLKI